MIADWLRETGAVTVPLFDADGLRPKTFVHNGMRKLKRHPAFDAALIDIVESGLRDVGWQGFVYVMHFGELPEFQPLYVGKTERKGTTQSLSFNILNIRMNQHAFGRWGYGLAYHIGDLSHAVFREDGRYKQPSPKYERWAQRIFASRDPPRLRRPVQVSLISWRPGMRGPSGLVGSVPAVEKELIALCSALPGTALLNVDGR